MNKMLLLLLIFAVSTPVTAEVGRRTGVIEEIQAESSQRQGYESIIYIKQSGTWSATDCPTPYAYYDAKTNSHFTAMFLAAKMANQPINIGVESTYPRFNSMCQIINVIKN